MWRKILVLFLKLLSFKFLIFLPILVVVKIFESLRKTNNFNMGWLLVSLSIDVETSLEDSKLEEENLNKSARKKGNFNSHVVFTLAVCSVSVLYYYTDFLYLLYFFPAPPVICFTSSVILAYNTVSICKLYYDDYTYKEESKLKNPNLESEINNLESEINNLE